MKRGPVCDYQSKTYTVLVSLLILLLGMPCQRPYDDWPASLPFHKSISGPKFYLLYSVVYSLNCRTNGYRVQGLAGKSLR
jgi:hypothetical protein